MSNKFYLREDRKAVAPTMKQPDRFPTMTDRFRVNGEWDKWNKHIASLPALDVDPDYLKTLRPGWFEGEERYELCVTNNGQDGWVQITKDNYDHLLESESLESSLRVTIIAPQEAEKDLRVTGVVQDVDRTALEFDKIRSEIALVGKKCIQCGKEFTDRSGGSYCSIQCWDAHCLHGVPHLEQPATPQPVTGEAETKPPFPDKMTFQQMFDTLFSRDFMSEEEFETICKAAEMYANGCLKQAASRPSDAVEFAEWMCQSGIRVYNGKRFYNASEIYQLFLNSKSPNPNK